MSGESIQKVVQPTVTEDDQRAPGLKFGDPRVMALFLALTSVQGTFLLRCGGYRHGGRYYPELAASRQLNSKELAIVGDILRPFDQGEIGFARAFRGEIRFGQQRFKMIRLEAKSWDFVTILLYKPHATRTRFFANWQALDYIRVAERSSRQFALELKKRGDDREGPRR